MQSLSSKIDVIANNIANADTVGFKSSRANFQDLLYQVRTQPGIQTSDTTTSPLGTQIGLGVTMSNTQIMHRQGSTMPGTNTDACINGDGFFQVDLPDGRIAYTRAGNFVRDSAGSLVLGNSFGYKLNGGPTIANTVPTQSVAIGSDGKISAPDANGVPQVLGQITLARFPNPGGLIQAGGNIFLESGASGPPTTGNPGTTGFGELLPGQLELSNTEAVTELVELIKTQRVFQMNSQTIQTADEALQTVANLRR